MNTRAVLFLLSLILLVACAPSPMEQDIQGVWEYQSDHLAEITAEQHLTVTWTFDRGAFVYSACCFLQNETWWGHYYLENETENRAIMQLRNIEGSNTGVEQAEIQVKYDPATDTLTIGSTFPFYRVSPSND
jgi:hypothetical protein